jgi:RIO kinase 1
MSDELDLLLADGIIDEVLGRLKSGKEANISLVRRGDDVIAAKVYKDVAQRSFKNNVGYKDGRKVRNTRTQRAMDSGGKFGRDAAEQAWKSAEADALGKLQGTGVRTPALILFYEGVLLMDLVLDAEGRPAPRMIDIAIPHDAALGVYADLCAQMIAMLCCDLIHGDLSPYNILAAADGPTIIDFPQVISAVHNTRAEFFFLRDFDNVVRFCAGFDPSLAVHTADGRAIWRAYVSRELTPQFVPPPPPPPRATRGPDRRGRPDDRGRPRNDGGFPQRPNQGPPRPMPDGGRPGGPRRDGPPPQGWSSNRPGGNPPPQRGGPPPQGWSSNRPGGNPPPQRGGPPPQGWSSNRPGGNPPPQRGGPPPQGWSSNRPGGNPPPSRQGPPPSRQGPPPSRQGPPPSSSGWSNSPTDAPPPMRSGPSRGGPPPMRSGPSSGGPPAARGGRRRPKRHW